MAHIYDDATLSPSKLELLTSWLPGRSWFNEFSATEVRQLASYRFDDPAGQVGLEGHLLQAGDGAVLHAPLTYRDAPLAGADQYLVGTTEHSVLGTRWVYDACGDPVWATALATAVLSGGTHAQEFVEDGGQIKPRQSSATVQGSGPPHTPVAAITAVDSRDVGQTTLIETQLLELVVVRIIGAEVVAPWTLTGQWNGGGPAALAGVAERLRPA